MSQAPRKKRVSVDAPPTPSADDEAAFWDTGELPTVDTQAAKEAEAEQVKALAKRYNENKARRGDSITKLPSRNVYELQLNEEELLRPRGTINFDQLVTTSVDPAEGEYDEFYKPPSNDEMRRQRDARERLRQDLERESAVRIFSPAQSIKPLNAYVQENMVPMLEAMRRKQAEEEARKRAEEQKQQEPPNRTLHVSGRALSLSRGGTHPEPPRPLDTVEAPFAGLPESDVAARTMERLDVETLTMVRWFEGRYLYHKGKAGIQIESETFNEQYPVLPEHVARVSTEAYEPFEPCFLRSYCCGASRLRHPKGPFPFIRYMSPAQWEEWERTGKKPANISSVCYWCYLFIMGYISDQNVRESQRGSKVFAEFYNPIERPGAYNRNAIRAAVEGYASGTTRPLRFFAPQQLTPCMRNVRKLTTDPVTHQMRIEEVQVRGWREVDEVLFFEGAHRDQHLQQMAPPSYTVTQLEAPAPTAVSVLRGEFLDPDHCQRSPTEISTLDLRPPLGSVIDDEVERIRAEMKELEEQSVKIPGFAHVAVGRMQELLFRLHQHERERVEEANAESLHPKGPRPSANNSIKRAQVVTVSLTTAPPKTTIGSLSTA